VSSLNHHVSLLRLRVHDAYMDFLETGKMPAPESVPADWSAPVLHRTRWYDLIDPRDRAEVLRGLWGMVGFLSRLPAR
jgi:hypothetical protein